MSTVQKWSLLTHLLKKFSMENFIFCVVEIYVSQLIHVLGSKNSRLEVFYKKEILKTFPKFTGKHLCWRLFFNKVADLRSAISLNRDFGTGIFLYNL